MSDAIEIPEALQQLVDRSNLIGDDMSLVVYGGGNTSSKGEVKDHLGRLQEVMWVKGSGADMRGSILSDYPGLRLSELLALRNMDELTDEQMTDFVTRALMDPSARRPSIETLLHAFLPFKHIDHVHADAICALTNHADGKRITAEALGEGFAYVDWMRPGFELSKIVGDLANYDGVVLAHHGLVNWAEDSDACLARTREIVAKAQNFVSEYKIPAGPPARHDDLDDDEIRTLLLRLRGSVSREQRRIVRVDDRLRHVADHPQLDAIVAGSVSSADHMLRIKPLSLALSDQAREQEDGIREAVDTYRAGYNAYVERNLDLMPEGFSGHDSHPRVVMVPGLGAITTGINQAEAKVAADIALHTHTVAATVLDTFGPPEPLPEAETFRFDYWPMELYKLSLKPAPKEFAGRVVAVTGAGSGIGRGISMHLAANGASLVLADLDMDSLEGVGAEITGAGGAEPRLVGGDQSDPLVVSSTIQCAIDSFGGIDGIVPNAGIGVPGNLDDLTLEQWELGLRVNLTSAFLLTQEAIRAFKIQGIGGAIAYVASKNAFGPGAGFGAYSASKAGMIQLMRIAAIEGGKFGIRANAVNPDAVFDNSKLWEGGVREERAAAHGIAPDELEDFYAARNLLNRRVTTVDVASSVAFLLSEKASRTTGCVITVDGGVSAAFPR
ncbi:MAG: bifunctional aldolase/short-chain dehydrogenase [Actinobacteria bacterium]|jgi:rhamnulose-1-phosphate aldolase/alcohol dehydrogenase|nr:bifunctional aldolase/short-chain dehydrogenase [Actinomycetota bacterium]MBT5501350.1 bifunctional aldolase/short-chain dehydrogenase [Actinomycetota bacterium]